MIDIFIHLSITFKSVCKDIVNFVYQVTSKQVIEVYLN